MSIRRKASNNNPNVNSCDGGSSGQGAFVTRSGFGMCENGAIGFADDVVGPSMMMQGPQQGGDIPMYMALKQQNSGTLPENKLDSTNTASTSLEIRSNRDAQKFMGVTSSGLIGAARNSDFYCTCDNGNNCPNHSSSSSECDTDDEHPSTKMSIETRRMMQATREANMAARRLENARMMQSQQMVRGGDDQLMMNDPLVFTYPPPKRRKDKKNWVWHVNKQIFEVHHGKGSFKPDAHKMKMTDIFHSWKKKPYMKKDMDESTKESITEQWEKLRQIRRELKEAYMKTDDGNINKGELMDNYRKGEALVKGINMALDRPDDRLNKAGIKATREGTLRYYREEEAEKPEGFDINNHMLHIRDGNDKYIKEDGTLQNMKAKKKKGKSNSGNNGPFLLYIPGNNQRQGKQSEHKNKHKNNHNNPHPQFIPIPTTAHADVFSDDDYDDIGFTCQCEHPIPSSGSMY